MDSAGSQQGAAPYHSFPKQNMNSFGGEKLKQHLVGLLALWVSLPVPASTDLLTGDNASWTVECLAHPLYRRLWADSTLDQRSHCGRGVSHLGEWQHKQVKREFA